MKVVISSGHGLKIRGASCDEDWGLDEVDEARRVVPAVARFLRARGVGVVEFHDDTSTDQQTNLETIVQAHNNAGDHDLDVSVHFNAYEITESGRGAECLFVTQEQLADDVAAAISEAGNLTNRGPKYNGGLYFLNNTDMPAILVEVAFVDSHEDADSYRENFEPICEAIATAIANWGQDDAVA